VITAVYDGGFDALSGGLDFAPSSSLSLTENVSQTATTSKVVSSRNPSVFGQSVTFTATIKAAAPGSGTPTGTITFMDGSMALGTGALNLGSPDTATFTTSTLAVGTHAITAVYGGDSNSTTSTSAVLSQTINKAGTSTALAASANPSTLGQPVTFTATIAVTSPGVGTPTGTVTFYNGTASLGSGSVIGGIATFTTSALSVGTHSIKAVYSGDGNFKTSTSAILSQVVNAAGVTAQGGSSASGPTPIPMGVAPSGTSSSSAPPTAVDQAIAGLQDDTSSDSLVHDVAVSQISPRVRRRTGARALYNKSPGKPSGATAESCAVPGTHPIPVHPSLAARQFMPTRPRR
jgi:hypothetical protein